MDARISGCILLLLGLTVQPTRTAAAQQSTGLGCTSAASEIARETSPDSLFSVVGRFDSGPALDVDAFGKVIYFSSGPFLVAADVSGEPFEIMRRRFGAPPVIAIRDSLAYIGTKDTLRIIDIGNPSSPVELGSTALHRQIDYLQISGDRAFIASGWGGLTIVNISDPSNPQEIGHLPAWQLSTQTNVACPNRVISVAARDSVAFVGSDYGLHVVELDLASNLAESKYFPGGFVSDLTIVDDVLFALGPDLKGYDISNPRKPGLLDSLRLGSTSREMIVRGDYGYIAAGIDGIHIVDLGNPLEMTFLITADVPYSLALAHFEDAIFVAGWWDGIHLLDIADPTTPELTGSIKTWDMIQDAAVQGDVAYLAVSRAGLLVLDVSSPENPTRITTLDLGKSINRIRMSEDLAFVVAGSDIFLLDVSDPAAPKQVGVFDAGGYVTDLTVRGELVYAAIGSDLNIFDVGDPAAPTRLGWIAYCQVFQHCVEKVDIANEMAYLSDYDGALRTIDVQDPREPRLTGTMEFPVNVYDVRTSGNLALVAAGSTLHILDLSNPSTLNEISSLDLGVSGDLELTLVGDEAYISAGRDGIVLVDFSDPAEPRIVGRSSLATEIFDVGPDGLVYTAGPGGLMILRPLSTDTSVELPLTTIIPKVEVYPNPFSSSVTFHNASTDFHPIRVEIFDLIGRRVRLIEGYGSLVWDGRDASSERASSGLYLCRIQVGASTETRPVVLRR